MKCIAVLFSFISLITFSANAQIKGYNLIKKDNFSRLHEKKGGEYMSYFRLYDDATFEFYFNSTGLSQKYSCGNVLFEKNTMAKITSDTNKLKNKRRVSIYSDERCSRYRFIYLKDIKIIFR